jgi:hypothetical protein
MIHTVILAIMSIFVILSALYIVLMFLKEIVDYYGPLIWGFWGEIWELENLTKLAKILIITIGFILYSIIMILSLYWLKPLFIKGQK